MDLNNQLVTFADDTLHRYSSYHALPRCWTLKHWLTGQEQYSFTRQI